MIVYLYICANLTIGGVFSAMARLSVPNSRSAEHNEIEWYSVDDDHGRRRQQKTFMKVYYLFTFAIKQLEIFPDFFFSGFLAFRIFFLRISRHIHTN